MPQTHPGYDIISRDNGTGEIRFIEVKGIDGEWNNSGVGLSRFQFDTARERGKDYWLYVVEFSFKESAAYVHPIMDPAHLVTKYMFDKNWRDCVAPEFADPAARFIPGAQVDCGPLGEATIISIQKRGHTLMLTMDFGNGKPRPLPLNLQYMKIIDSDDNS